MRENMTMSHVRFSSPSGIIREARLRFLNIILVCGLLASCAAERIGVLEPIAATVPDASRVDLLVATTRASSPERGVVFSGERSEELSFAALSVSIPPDNSRQTGQVQWPQSSPPDPARDFATLNIKRLSASQAGVWINAHSRSNRRVLVFVHGFNTRFEAAVYRFAQIVHDSGAEAAPLLFTWPSRGSVFDYAYDKESANFSRDVLEALLQHLAKEPGVGEIAIVAHSMGAWLTTEALRQMAIRNGRIAPKIRQVILAAPDIDVDVFASQLRSMGHAPPQFTIFVSRADRALRLSRGIAGDVERLGRIDPAGKPWLSRKGVEVVDLTGLSSADALRHGKFAENPEVVRFLGAELINGETPRALHTPLGERLGGMSMGMAESVGDAVGLAIAAPIAIVDPAVRRAYAEQAERTMRALGNAATAASGGND